MVDICNLKVKTLSTVAAVHYHVDYDMFLSWLVHDSVTVKIITQDVILNNNLILITPSCLKYNTNVHDNDENI